MGGRRGREEEQMVFFCQSCLWPSGTPLMSFSIGDVSLRFPFFTCRCSNRQRS